MIKKLRMGNPRERTKGLRCPLCQSRKVKKVSETNEVDPEFHGSHLRCECGAILYSLKGKHWEYYGCCGSPEFHVVQEMAAKP